MTTENLPEKWENLRRGYKPGPDDNPDNFDWYARYFATKQILLDAGFVWDEVKSICHQGVSWGCEDMKGFLLNVRKRLLPVVPEEPISTSYRWDSEPMWDIDERARKIFKSQFRSTWPDKRINSRFAKEKWEKVKRKVVGIARSEFQNVHDAWKEREEVRNKQMAKEHKEWEKKRDVIVRISEGFRTLMQACGVEPSMNV